MLICICWLCLVGEVVLWMCYLVVVYDVWVELMFYEIDCVCFIGCGCNLV